MRSSTRAGAQRPRTAERLVHALAQVPDDVTLELRRGDPAQRQLQLLASAYGVSERIRFSDDSAAVLAAPDETLAELADRLAPNGGMAATRRGSDELFAGQRIAIVTNLPAHYRIPLFNGLQGRLGAAGARLRVFFTGSDPARRTYMRPGTLAFEHEFLRTWRAPLNAGDVPLGLERRLRAFDPTLALAAGFAPGVAARVARFASQRGIGFGVWSGELPSAATASGRARTAQRRWVLRRARFAVAYGSLATEYLHSIAPELPVVIGRNTAPAQPLPPRAPDAGARVEVVSVGQAIPRKGLDVLVDAFALMTDLPCRLTIVGGGPQLAELERRAEGLPSVRLLGAVPSDEVREAYRAADVVAFPTRFDTFGLVLVESLGSGRATVVSAAAGAVPDLCISGRNSLVVHGHDPRAWADAIRRLVVDGAMRARLAGAGRETISRRWTVDHAVDAMSAGLRLGVLTGGDRIGRP